MKKSMLTLAGFLFALVLRAQETVKIEDIGKHVGDSVRVCTKIYGGIFLDRSKGTPTLLNAGGNYPDAPLTIVIWADTRARFKEAPEVFYREKEVCVTGKIVLYREKPQIVVTDEKQIQLASQ